MKKKVLALLAAMILCFALTACGGPSVEEAIVGEWHCDMGYSIEAYYEFNADGTIDCTPMYAGEALDQTHGTYTIGDSTIDISWDSGTVVNFPYTMDGGELQIESSAGEGIYLEKIK